MDDENGKREFIGPICTQVLRLKNNEAAGEAKEWRVSDALQFDSRTKALMKCVSAPNEEQEKLVKEAIAKRREKANIPPNSRKGVNCVILLVVARILASRAEAPSKPHSKSNEQAQEQEQAARALLEYATLLFSDERWPQLLFDLYARRFQSPMLSTAIARGRVFGMSREDAEDVVHNILRRELAAFDRGDFPELTWSLRRRMLFAVHNGVVDWIKGSTAWTEAAPTLEVLAKGHLETQCGDPLRHMSSDDTARNWLKCLPAQQRAIVWARAVEELTFEEIGTALRISASHAWALYTSAIAQLKESTQPV